MKKRNLKTLKLAKKTISRVSAQAVGGIFRTAECYTRQICPIEPDPSDPLEPIPDQPTLFEASVCFCYSATC
ncbi:hypothetical protein U8527_05145 [Kordia algicida OT-1]|uniref:Uncharacterized protein n=1 Tax=Kordia algicida OT-1 TaxID=391587 RepID=A9DMH4_9FLAO|nr:hypothetical protein [Kordia algicida]EDP97707.1 hypothetical protein KAOT1_21132 [Kordia algicida OT-1]